MRANYSWNSLLKQHPMILERPTFNRMLRYTVSLVQMTIISRGKSVSTTRTRSRDIKEDNKRTTNVVQPRDVQRRNVHSNAHPGGNFISKPKKNVDTNAPPPRPGMRLKGNAFLRWKELLAELVWKRRKKTACYNAVCDTDIK